MAVHETQGERVSPGKQVAAGVGVAAGLMALGGLAAVAAVGGAVVIQDRLKRSRKPPLNQRQWQESFEKDGRFKQAAGEKIIGTVRLGGCEPELRAQVWPYLLRLYDFQSSETERQKQGRDRSEEYDRLRRTAVRVGDAAVKHERERERKQLEEEEKVARARADSSAMPSVQLQGKDRDSDNGSTSPRSEVCDVTEASTCDQIREEGDATTAEGGSLEGSGRKGDMVLVARRRDEEGEENEWAPVVIEQEEIEAIRKEEEEEGKAVLFTYEDPLPEPFSEGGKALSEFSTWRRIMRLDAVRMNAAWIPYSTQKDVSADEADAECERVALGVDASHLSAPQRLHAARLVAVLEAYAVTDPVIGYCQGMSDLLSPFVALMEDDADAFWCFRQFMSARGARHNFRRDERGIRSQLRHVSSILQATDPKLFAHLEEIGADECIFVYRMLVVLLRRELSFEQTISLWEVVWADEIAAEWEAEAEEAAESVGAHILLPRQAFGFPIRGSGKPSLFGALRRRVTWGGGHRVGDDNGESPSFSLPRRTTPGQQLAAEGAVTKSASVGGDDLFGKESEEASLWLSSPPPDLPPSGHLFGMTGSCYGQPRPDLLQLVVAAIVIKSRKQVLQCCGLDEVLRLNNSLSGQLNVWDVIGLARHVALRAPCLRRKSSGSEA